MAEIVKVLSAEITLNGTANLVSNAVAVRINNANTTAATVITIVPASGSNTSTTLLPSSSVILQKPSDAKIASSLTSLVTATSVAFS